MTDALCFGCGAIKFGAWCPCRDCRTLSSGNKDIDLVFSDHSMSRRNLEEFGGFLKLLKTRCEDKAVCFWAFLSYVSTCHPSLLTSRPPEDLAVQVETLLAGVEMPEIELEPGLREVLEKQKAEKPAGRRSWRFWR